MMQQPARPYFIIAQEQPNAQHLLQQLTPSQASFLSNPNLSLTLNSANLSANYPELSLQLGQFLPHYGDHGQGASGVDQLSKLHEGLAKAGQRAASNNSGGRNAPAEESKNSSAYASRHQAAEQRRRTRINERLDMLRKMIPHSERANTASFLEEVIKWVDSTKRRVAEMEAALHMATKNLSSGRVMERLSTAADAEHQQLQQLQHTNNVILGGGVHLSLGGGSSAAYGNGGGGSDDLPSGLLASGIPNLRPQPQQHALFHTAAVAPKMHDEYFKESPLPRPATLSLSMLGPAAAANGGQHHVQQGTPPPSAEQAWGRPGSSGGNATAAAAAVALQQLQEQVLQLGQQQQQQQQTAKAAGAAAGAAGNSPVSSEESGVPLKKRKVLVL